MSTTKKITKKEVLEAIVKVLKTQDGNAKVGDTSIMTDEAVEVIKGMISQLDHKAEQARKRAAKKKIEGDELRDIVEGVLTNEPQIIDVITAQVDFEGATKAKITARLTQLVNADIATKEQVKTGDGRKVMAYKLVKITEDTDADTDADTDGSNDTEPEPEPVE